MMGWPDAYDTNEDGAENMNERARRAVGGGQVLRYLWAAPCTLAGLAAALPLLLGGAQARLVLGVLEVSGSSIARRWPFDAITFGHVVLAHTPRAMARWRRHERAHVRQCERWGPLFFPAYLVAGAWQWLRGRSAYWDNPFEIQARNEALDAGDCA